MAKNVKVGDIVDIRCNVVEVISDFSASGVVVELYGHGRLFVHDFDIALVERVESDPIKEINR